MANKTMKTLTVGSNTYEVVDATARADIKILNEKIIIDDTLTQSGCVADAKVVGDAINTHLSSQNPHNVTKEQIGLNNVDNTSDVNKPVSTAQQTAINVVQTNLTNHKKATNPHGITLSDMGVTATVVELNYMSGITSNVKTQLDNKLPLSGGTVTGDLTVNGGCTFNGDILCEGDINSGDLYITSTNHTIYVDEEDDDGDLVDKVLINLSSSGTIHIGAKNNSGTDAHSGSTYINAPNGSVYLTNSDGSLLRWFKHAGEDYNNIFRCETDVDAILGSASCRWLRIYNSTSSCTTSDEREKSDITPISDYPVMYTVNTDENVFEQFFDKLTPTTYTLNFEKGNKLHIGFIAQEVESAANEIGLPVEELGFVLHDYWKDEETGEEKDRYSLGYEEFIALNTYIIQKQQSKIKSLEERIVKLESLINV